MNITLSMPDQKCLLNYFRAAGLIILSVCLLCFGQTASERFMPPSKSQIPAESAKEAEAKCRAFLNFFKTPAKQFMPLGFYGMAAYMQNPDELRILRQGGVVLFHKYSGTQTIEDALADLRSAQEAGAVTLQNLPRTYIDGSNAIYNATKSTYLNAKEIEFWQKYITALANNDQILAWYLPEEIEPNNLDKWEQLSDIIRTIDTKKRPLITSVDKWYPAYLKRVGHITDAVVFASYPSYYMPRPRADIKRRIEKAYENGAPVVIAALEALKGRRNWTRPKDVRFDAYLSLISGAKGIMWYAYNYAKPRPGLVEAVLGVATELNGPENLGEVLLLGKEPTSLKCRLLEGPKLSPPATAYDERDWQKEDAFKQYDSIQWTAREYKNCLYIFAVNTAQKVEEGPATDDGGAAYTVRATFGPINSPFSKIQVISENREIGLSDGYLTDTFEPIGVHIYKIKLN